MDGDDGSDVDPRDVVASVHGGEVSPGRPGGGIRASALTWLGRSLVPREATWRRRGEGDAPDVLLGFEVCDGRPECTQITIRRKPGGRGIRTSDLGLQLDNLAVGTFTELTIASDESRIEKDVYVARTSRRGVPTRAELERVAQTYREHFDRMPVQAVQQLHGYGSARTAHRRVEQAREAGLLPPTTPGQKRK